MAELDLIQSTRDAVEFSAFLFDRFSAELLVDDGANREPVRLCDVDQVYPFLLANPMPPLLFAVSPAWQQHPVHTQEVSAQDGRRLWCIEQRYGGPAFTWMLSRVLTPEDRPFFSCGLFGDYPWYYVAPGSSERFKRPDAMADAMDQIRAYVRSTSRRARYRDSGRVGPWVASDALRWASAGVALGPEAEWLVRRAA